jgi:hypothetical protein
MQHVLAEVTNFLNWLATNLPISGIMASGALSAALVGPKQLVEKWFVHYKAVMITLVGIGGILIAGVHYMVASPDYSWQIVYLQGLAIAFGTQPFYRILIKPGAAALGAWLLKQAEKAAQLNEAKTAKVPVSGLKVTYGGNSEFES